MSAAGAVPAGLARFSTVVVAYGSAAEIADVVEGALALDGCDEVIVVDNGTDGSAAIAEAAGARTLQRPDNPGFGTAQNAGVALTSSAAVLLLNPDALIDPAGVAAGLSHLARHAEVAAVQGVIVNRATGEPERSMGDELGPVHLLGRALFLRRLLGTSAGRWLATRVGAGDHVDRVPTGPREVETLAATAVLVRRSAFDEVDGFDETYFLYGEDLDLCRRLRGAGWTLVGLPVRWADHESGGTSASWWSREVRWWEGTLGFAARWWSPRDWLVAQVAAWVRLVELIVVRPTHAREAWSALVSAPRRDRRARRHDVR